MSRAAETLLFCYAAVAFVVCAFVAGSYIGVTAGRCAERWRYQTTAADTLRTVRGGCDLPFTPRVSK